MSKTIMLVHGAWVTADCWASFRSFFEAKGYRVVVPPWPYLDKPVEELRRNPDPRLAKITIKDLVDHFERQIQVLPEKPILRHRNAYWYPPYFPCALSDDVAWIMRAGRPLLPSKEQLSCSDLTGLRV